MKAALLQMPVTADKAENLAVAEDYICRAAEAGADLAILPEMFCCPYTNASFVQNAEAAGEGVYHRHGRGSPARGAVAGSRVDARARRHADL